MKYFHWPPLRIQRREWQNVTLYQGTELADLGICLWEERKVNYTSVGAGGGGGSWCLCSYKCTSSLRSHTLHSISPMKYDKTLKFFLPRPKKKKRFQVSFLLLILTHYCIFSKCTYAKIGCHFSLVVFWYIFILILLILNNLFGSSNNNKKFSMNFLE